MPAFRRPPDWDQHAVRHTPLIDPVVTVRQLARFGFARRAHTRIDHALVFSTPEGAYETFLPPLRPSRTSAAAKHYTAVYEVDMGIHPLREELRLPSADDAFEFEAVVDLSWHVADPALFVKSGHRDVPRMLVGELEQAARPFSRRFPVHRSSEAERVLLEEVPVRCALGTRAGLAVSWTVRLRGDQGAVEHASRMRAIDHTTTEQVHTETRGLEHDAAADLRAAKRAELEDGRTAANEQREHELQLLRQQRQHTAALARTRQTTELQQANAEKIAFYEKHLEQGGVHAWALHLAEHPEDMKVVVDSLRQDQLRVLLAQLKLAEQLLGGDGAESHELEAPKNRALRNVIDVLSQYLPGVTVEDTRSGRLSITLSEDEPGTAPKTASLAHGRGPAGAGRTPPTPADRWEPPQGYGKIPVQPAAPAPDEPDHQGGAE
ncbi:hypothetical protein ACWCPT_04205 [Streptomyces sp. NPDC002308]